MKAIRESPGLDFEWVRLKWSRRYFEIRSAGEAYAKLYKQKGAILSEAADGQWTFKRRSFWNGEIAITDMASGIEIAALKRGRKQSIVFSDGRMLMWRKVGFLGNQWDWIDSDDSPLIHFRHGKQIVLEPVALSFPALSLLVIAGLHLVILRMEAAAAASAG